MNLLLARHGNTFGPDDTPVWVGADQDLPLVPKGREQAKAVGQALASAGITPTAIVAGPLKRTAEHATIIRDIAGGGEISIDHRLREIDYGSWGGKTTEQIVETHGEAAVTAWNERGQWPDRADWQPDLSTLRRDLKLLVNDLQAQHGADDTVLLVSSNGILRFFLDLVPGAFALRARDQSLKTATGALSCIQRQGGLYQVLFWNRRPDDIDLSVLNLQTTETPA